MKSVTSRIVRIGWLAAAAFAVAALYGEVSRASDPDALWKIVHDRCVPDQQEHANPAPCVEVSIAGGVEEGFAVLKDNSPAKPYEYLLIPTKRITGIESPSVLMPQAAHYFDDAWAARSYVMSLAKADLARDMVALAVNSEKDRSQNQLHIHIDCVRPDIRSLLKDKEEILSGSWSRLELGAQVQTYMALKLGAETLSGASPFRLLSDGLPGAAEHMDLETLVVIGAVFKDGRPGFYLLSNRHEGFGTAHGEDLLDPSCRLATQPG